MQVTAAKISPASEGSHAQTVFMRSTNKKTVTHKTYVSNSFFIHHPSRISYVLNKLRILTTMRQKIVCCDNEKPLEMPPTKRKYHL